jgi:superfamily II DNA/RNA helicase
MSIRRPTPVQAACIPTLLDGTCCSSSRLTWTDN